MYVKFKISQGIFQIGDKTPEEMTDNITKDNIQSFSEILIFFTFLFEMWCASRR